jgi:hypothetical protein
MVFWLSYFMKCPQIESRLIMEYFLVGKLLQVKISKLKIVGLCWLGLVIVVPPAFASSLIAEQMNAQADVMKKRVIKERDEEIAAHKSSVENKIESINEDTEIEIAKIPAYYYNAWGYRLPNPDYERTVAYIKVDAEKQINAINKDLAAYTKGINACYQEKLDAIDESAANVGSQIKPGTSEVQLTPIGSNLYVKNYVNYAVEPAKPPVLKGLRAKQNSLACKTGTQNKKTGSNN